MTLALGLGAIFVGAALAISGYRFKHPAQNLPGMLFGNWYPGDTSLPANAAGGTTSSSAHAASGGAHAPSATGNALKGAQ